MRDGEIRRGDAYYPQICAVGFFEPTTGTFNQIELGFRHMKSKIGIEKMALPSIFPQCLGT